jgi:hypothetical protein
MQRPVEEVPPLTGNEFIDIATGIHLKTVASDLQSDEARMHQGRNLAGSEAAHMSSIANKFEHQLENEYGVHVHPARYPTHPSAVDPDKVRRHLAALKTIAVEHQRRLGTAHPAASEAQSAHSHYLSAAAQEFGLAQKWLDKSVNVMPMQLVDEYKLAQELREEADFRFRTGRHDMNSPAYKCRLASHKFDLHLRDDETHL